MADKISFSDTERMIELEIHVAQLEATTLELNEVIRAQWQAIDTLKTEVQNLKNFIREFSLQDSLVPSREPPPPHY